MDYLLTAGISLILGVLGGGYLGYRYGRTVEAKARQVGTVL